ncbi:MAG: methyltransferase domain-containing protein [Candidatus Hodarchaeota archaeon]
MEYEKKKKIESAYDKAAQKYANHFFDELDNKPLDRKLLDLFAERVLNRGKVCEIGCGPGEVSHYLKAHNVDIFGIDISQKMVNEARKLSPNIKFEKGDVFNLHFDNKSLAGVVAFYLIVNFSLEDVEKASYVYVADRIQGLEIYDISNPTTPTLLSRFNESRTQFHGSAKGVFIQDPYAYLAEWYDGLEIIDISDPTPPTLVSRVFWSSLSYPEAVFVSGSYACAASHHGVRIIDVSDPTNATQTSTFDADSRFSDIFVNNSYVYAFDSSEDALKVIDISNTTNPVKIGQYNISSVRSIAISGSYAYITPYFKGLEVIDFSDPSNPVKVGQFSESWHFYVDIVINDSYAYLATESKGVTVLDISDPTYPTKVAQYTDNSSFDISVRNIFVSESDIYASDYSHGFQILQWKDGIPTTSTIPSSSTSTTILSSTSSTTSTIPPSTSSVSISSTSTTIPSSTSPTSGFEVLVISLGLLGTLIWIPWKRRKIKE